MAALLYVEMLEAGFTRVGEFHYLHHDRDGKPYADLAEMAARIAAAAGETGIGLTLLPVFYAHGGFGGEPPNSGQRRFVNDLDRFARLMEQARVALSGLEGAMLGIAPHSLRAVTAEELTNIVPLAEGGPIHIHVAEQMKEVEDCLAWSGARPVEWLLEHAPVDKRWCLIHATHMTDAETRAVASASAVAGLCPITEANLGDGTFNAPEFIGLRRANSASARIPMFSSASPTSFGNSNIRSACITAPAMSWRARKGARPVAPFIKPRSSAERARSARRRPGSPRARPRTCSRSMPLTPPWSGAPATLFSTLSSFRRAAR